MKPSQNLQELFLVKIQALYDVENRLVKALPKMAKSATDKDLAIGFTSHLAQTQEHVKRLEKVFELMEESPKKLSCEGIKGIIQDAEWTIDNTEKGAALDAALIAAGSHAEHYEISGYTTAIEWARLLEETEAADLMEKTLTEERATDQKMMALGRDKINERAELADTMEEDDEEE